ncbi:MAG: peptidase, partial [Verrucomicrobiota bacterium]
ENTRHQIESALCLEGIDLGRLSYSSLGMQRGEILVRQEDTGWSGQSGSGVIGPLNKIVDRILAIERPEKPKTSILLGSVEAGSGYSVPPTKGSLRFEVRSECAETVEKIGAEIQSIVDEVGAQDSCDIELATVAQRTPGDIGFNHPLVAGVRAVLDELDIKPRVDPSISELSALLDKGVPSVTLGITTGEHRHTPEEKIDLEPMFSGIAQIVATLELMDKHLGGAES